MKYLIFIILHFIFSSLSLGQFELNKQLIEPYLLDPDVEEQPGGLYMPSIAENGQYIKVLILFVQFKDDNWEPTWSEWRKNQPPTTWMNTNMIDQSVGQNSTNGNITHYFSVMSMGHYKVIGNFAHWVTPRTRDEYISLGWKRGLINRDILQNMYNNEFDFAPYDILTKNGPYDFDWGPDGEIDMIWMIYRNISKDKPDPLSYAIQLGFASASLGIYSGEASLGGGGTLYVNAGKWIDLGGFGLVSGINVMGGYNGLSWVKGVTVHEFGHHLLGGNSAHLRGGVWGIMSSYGRRSQVVNSYERQKLGWINLIQYNYNPLIPFPLYDYVTTGNALKIAIPGTSKYYLIENHQRSSTLDDFDLTTDGKGVYVLYQDLYQGDPANLGLYFYNAEGRSIWSFDHYATHPVVGVQVPVFREGLQDRINGKFDTEYISYIDPITGMPKSDVIEAYVNYNNIDVFQPLFKGNGNDMMKPGYVEVFSPWSNPPLQSVAFQVIVENNQIKINQKVVAGTQLSLPPAKPQNLLVTVYNTGLNSHPKLNWDVNLEDDVQTASPGYLIERKINSGTWSQIAAVGGTTTQYIDYAVNYAGSGANIAYYKIRAKDTQGLISVYSDINSIQYGDAWKIGTDQEKVVSEYSLLQNYPNPFNPVTNISFSIPKNGLVTLKVYDILGSEVAELVNEVREAGNYSVTFNALDLPSGIYFYTLTTGNFNATKKLILLK